MKELRSGGQAQGTLMGFPLASLTAPSQSPVPETNHDVNKGAVALDLHFLPPVGFTPAAWPKSGTRAGSMARLIGREYTGAKIAATVNATESFIMLVNECYVGTASALSQK